MVSQLLIILPVLLNSFALDEKIRGFSYFLFCLVSILSEKEMDCRLAGVTCMLLFPSGKIVI